MVWVIIIFYSGINLSPFLFYKLNMWQANGLWVQITAAIIFSLFFTESPNGNVKIKNIPLALLFFWSFLTTIIWVFVRGIPDHIFWFLNILTMVIIYKGISEYLIEKDIKNIFMILRYVTIGTLLICTLQNFGLAQFFIYFKYEWFRNINNPVIGFIGQPTHLAGLLAMTLPIFIYYGKRLDILSIILLLIILIFLTGTTMGQSAVSGIAVLFGVSIYSLFYLNKRLFTILTMMSLFSVILIMYFKNTQIISDFLSSNGRYEIWQYYFNGSKKYFLSGLGLGTVALSYTTSKFPNAMHIHLEYLQILVELGLVGLILFLNVIRGYFLINLNTKEAITLKSMTLGFLISCLFNYPAHLWLPASYAVLGYAGLYSLNGERLCQLQPKNK